MLSTGILGLVGLAGCLGGGSDGGGAGNGGTTTGTTRTRATTRATGTTATRTRPGTTAKTATPSATTTPTETETTVRSTRTETTAELQGPDWKTASLTDVRDRESFRIGAFERPVLLETFAVWCPACTEQQTQIEKLRERRDDFVAVSLNVDSNENATTVYEHAEDNGFDWRFAVAPTLVTDSLVDQFGPTITVAPQAPVVRDCGASATLLENGVKSADALAAALDEC